MGHGVDGGFTKYVVVREDMLYPIPDFLTLEEAALAEPFATAVQAIEELTVFNVGETVLLSGPGPIGLMCLSLLVNHGCRVIVAGTRADDLRLKTAKTMGAFRIVTIDTEPIDKIVFDETKGTGADSIVECSGSEAAVSTGLKLVKKLGQYVQVGIIGNPITLDFDTLLYKQLKVLGVLGHSLNTWELVMKIFASQKVDLTPIISHKLPLSQWKEGFDLSETKQGIKILLYYDE
jgi:L-iditol 2-dehydrogenase